MTESNFIITKLGNPPQQHDRNKLKIATFRTKEGLWSDFTAAANALGLTATDIIRVAMEQFVAGDYTPHIPTAVNKVVNTANNTAISTSINTDNDELAQRINTAINTAINTETIEAAVMAVVGKLSLPTIKDVNTSINTALIQDKYAIEKKIDISLRPIQDTLYDLNEFTGNIHHELSKLQQQTKSAIPRSIVTVNQSIDLPDWVTTANRRWYNKFINNDELLAEVVGAIGLAKDNRELAGLLIPLGLCKLDGNPLDLPSVAHLKTVAAHIKAAI